MPEAYVLTGPDKKIYEYVKTIYMNSSTNKDFIVKNTKVPFTKNGNYICNLLQGTWFTGSNIIERNGYLIENGVQLPPDKNKDYVDVAFSGEVKLGNSTHMNVYVVITYSAAEAGSIAPSLPKELSLTSKSYASLVNSDSTLNLLRIDEAETLKYYVDKYGESEVNNNGNTDIFTNDAISSMAAANSLGITAGTVSSTMITPVTTSYNADMLGEINADSVNWAYEAMDENISTLDGNTTKLDLYRGVFGMPYQFLDTTDARLGMSTDDATTGVGVTYSEKILSRMPLLFLTPGESTFAAISQSKKTGAIQQFIESFADGITDAETQLSKLLDGYEGKFYTMNYAYYQYYKYVNPMCRMGAIYLGLHKKEGDEIPDDYYKIDSEWVKNYNWALNGNEEYEYEEEMNEDDNNTSFSKVIRRGVDLLYYKSCIPFYINSDVTFSESMSNETVESSLASTINGFSDKARELQFILGTSQNMVASQYSSIESSLAESKAAVDAMVNNISAGKNNIFSTLVNSVSTIVKGGRLIFPNIWSNSSVSKSYEITIRLTTPDNDKKSWWLNIYVPLCHLIAFVLPHGEYKNGYTSPFLVKAFYKGMFNIDMGIITDMSITKGKEGGWTKDALPTVVEVRMTIQDLYSQLSITPTGQLLKSNVMQNISEMDYLANLCGVNINEPDLKRMMEMFVILNVENIFVDIIPDIGLSITQAINNTIFRGIYDNNLAAKLIRLFKN